MRVPHILASTALLLALGSPALAQGTTSQNSTAATSNSQTAQSSTDQGGGDQQNMALAQKIQKDLQNAGFTDVKIVARSFVVQAKSSTGEPVVMTIGPHGMSVFEAMNSGSSSGSSATTGSASGSANSSPSSSTTSNTPAKQ